MTINSMLPAYREEANNTTKDNYVKSKMILLAQRAFADGVTSILQVNAKKSKTTKEATVQLNENISTFIKAINKHKPATAKGRYVKNASLSLTMSPSVTLDTQEVMDLK